MRSSGNIAAFLFVGLFLVFVPHFPAATRLAIVSSESGTSPAADLLTAQLSGLSGLELVERQQVNKAVAELSLASDKQGLQLGQTLGADGVLRLSLQTYEKEQFLSLQLLAVHPGIRLMDVRYQWPLTNLIQWASNAPAALSPFLPKLLVGSNEARLVSILNLRSAVKSREGERQEETLKLLLYARLAKESSIFVSERQFLDLAAAEKELKQVGQETFLNGSWLFDAVINGSAVQGDEVNIEGRLKLANGNTSEIVAAKGTGKKLEDLVTELARKIIEKIEPGTKVTAWDPGREAAQFFEEAKWLQRWNVYDEAARAARTAWTLGRNTRDAAELVITASTQDCAGPLGGCHINQAKQRVMFELGQPSKLDKMLTLSGFYVDRTQELFPNSVDAQWTRLGVDLLNQGSAWLRYYYFVTEARDSEKDKITELRHWMSRIADRLANAPGTNPAITEALSSSIAHDVVFWAESPESAVDSYRTLLKRGSWNAVRSRFINAVAFQRPRFGISTPIRGAGANADLASPCIGGWTGAERQRASQIWEQFMEELAASPDVQVQIEGLFLKTSWAWADADFLESLKAVSSSIEKEFAAGRLAVVDSGMLTDLRIVMELRSEPLAPTTELAEAKKLFSALEDKFKGAEVLARQAAKEAEARADQAARVSRAKMYLNGDVLDLAFDQILRGPFSAVEAQELLAALETYRERMTKDPKVASRNNFRIGAVESRLARFTNSKPGGAAQPTGGGRVTTSPPRTNQFVPIAQTNSATSARFWSLPVVDRDVGFRAATAPGPRMACFRDGKLWLEVQEPEENNNSTLTFYAVDLKTFGSQKSQKVERLTDAPIISSLYGGREDRAFDVWHGQIFRQTAAGCDRWEQGVGKWQAMKLPASGTALPRRVGDRLFFVTGDSLLEFQQPESFRIWASARRRPPQNPLDEVGSFGHLTLFGIEHGEVCALVGDQVYRWAAGADNCQKALALSGLGVLEPVGLENGLVFYARANGYGSHNRLFGLFPGDKNFSLLIEDPATNLQPARSMPTNTVPGFPRRAPPFVPSVPARVAVGETNRALFEAPGEFPLAAKAATWKDGSLWVLGESLRVERGAEGPLSAKEGFGRNALLLQFVKGQRSPAALPLHLKFDLEQLGKRAMDQVVSFGLGRPFLIETPDGLVLFHRLIPGFWFISNSQLAMAK